VTLTATDAITLLCPRQSVTASCDYKGVQLTLVRVGQVTPPS
jgi:hypothetical protein